MFVPVSMSLSPCSIEQGGGVRFKRSSYASIKTHGRKAPFSSPLEAFLPVIESPHKDRCPMNDPNALNSLRALGRVDVEAAAKLSGFHSHDIPVLIRAGLLKPLGSPAPNAPKYFARCEIEQKASDVKWLDRATRVVSEHWRRKNQRRQSLNEIPN